MRTKQLSALPFIVRLFVLLMALNAMGVSIAAAQSQQAIPDDVVYARLFHRIALLKLKADQAQSRGQDRSFLRGLIRTRAGLTREEGAILETIAFQCEADVTAVDMRAAAIIRRLKAQFPHGLVPRGATPPSVPGVLVDLQRERTTIILSARDKLHIGLGESSFALLNSYAQKQAISDISPSR
jgi:hypothetical protein